MLKESKSSGSKMTPSCKWPAAAFLSLGKYRFLFNSVIWSCLPYKLVRLNLIYKLHLCQMMTLQLQGCSPYSLKPNINASKKQNFVTNLLL